MPAYRKGPRPSYVGAVRDDVVALHARVATQMVAIAVVIEGCKDKLDAPTNAQWDDVAKRALTYASADVPLTGSYDADMAQGAALLTELNAWGAKLDALGCSKTPPPIPVPPPKPQPTPDTPFNTLVSSLGDLKWIAIAYVAYQALRSFK